MKEKFETTQGPQLESIVIDYLKSIFRGISGGLYDSSIGLAHTVTEGVLHPYDNLYVPMKDFFYNAIIVGAGMHGDNPLFMDGDFAILHREIQANPKLYHDALDRVQENAIRLKAEIQAASGPQRTEMGVRAAVGIFAPGYFLKIARGFAHNLEQFGTIRTPLRFPNWTRSEKVPGLCEPFPAQFIKQEKMTGKYIWVLDENNKLIISHYGPGEPGGMLWQMFRYYHSSVSGLKPVISAGELLTTEGTITLINNNSGHFRSFGGHLKTVVEHAFMRDGFPEAVGKFKTGNYDRFARIPEGYVPPKPFRPSQGYGLPAVDGTAAGAVAQMLRHSGEDDAFTVGIFGSAHAAEDTQPATTSAVSQSTAAASAYTSLLPSRASLGIGSRREQHALSSPSTPASTPVVTRPGDDATVYTSILPPRTASGMTTRAPGIAPPISFSSSFLPSPDTPESIMKPLVESLMPAPRMDSSQFGRSDMPPPVFSPSPMQALATSLDSRPPIGLAQTMQSRMTPPVSAPQMPIPHVPTLVESLMPAPSMQALATSWTSRPPIDFAQRMQTTTAPAMSVPSPSAFHHVPTAGTHLGFAPNPNPMQSVIQSLNQSRVNPIQALQDRMEKKR